MIEVIHLALVWVSICISVFCIVSGLLIIRKFIMFKYASRLADYKMMPLIFIAICMTTSASVGYCFLIYEWAYEVASQKDIINWHFVTWTSNHVVNTFGIAALHLFIHEAFQRERVTSYV